MVSIFSFYAINYIAYALQVNDVTNMGLDLFGDKCTFLIIRDLVQGKKFYKDFLISKEGIATNILSNRLKNLEHNGMVEPKAFEMLKTKKEKM